MDIAYTKQSDSKGDVIVHPFKNSRKEKCIRCYQFGKKKMNKWSNNSKSNRLQLTVNAGLYNSVCIVKCGIY